MTVNVPDGLEGFVNDYVITVFEVAWLSDEVLKLLSAMTGDRRYEGLLSAGEEIGNMCDVAERLERKGVEIGKEMGLMIGANNTIFKLVSKGRLTPEEGAEELNMEMTEFMNSLEEWKLTAKA